MGPVTKRYISTLVIALQLTQGVVWGVEVQVNPKYAIVNIGEEMAFMCKLNSKLDSCSFKIGGIGYSMKPGKEKDGIKYMGKGLDNGECGILIQKIEEKHNGNITCSMALDSSDPTEKVGEMHLVVGIIPQEPEMEISPGSGGKNIYKERELMHATCTVRDARPTANITWYMGDDMIRDGLRMAVETCTPQKMELCTIQQNLTRSMQSSDHTKMLKCVATHPSLKDRNLTAEYPMEVIFRPKPHLHPIEHFGLAEGNLGTVPVNFEANPKPIVHWKIDQDTLYEGQTIGRFTLEKTEEKEPGKFESILHIEELHKDDTDKKFTVTAHNAAGETDYSVFISTSPGPKVLVMRTGLIIGISATVIIILAVLIVVIYARAKGKFCFAAKDTQPRIAGESSDTESCERPPDTKPRFDFVTVFKKKSDKTAVDKEVLKNESVAKEDLPSLDRESGESVVYAELDLSPQNVGPSVVRGDDDKTEYAEIIHTKASQK